MKKNIVLGAGPAGLFCAHEMKDVGETSVILEKTSVVGGLAATHKLGDFSFEIGPHIFQSLDQYIFEIASAYLQDDFVYHEWKVEQYLDGRLLVFPNNIANMWRELGTLQMFKFIGSFLKYQLTKPDDFRSFIYKKVGKELANFNVINYTEKMWGVSIDELEYDWIKPRLDRISIWKIIRSAFAKNKRHFYYPILGAGQLYDQMSKSQDIRFDEFPERIEYHKNEITAVQSNKERYNVAQLFSSIPIAELVQLLSPAVPDEIVKSINALRYRSQIYVVLALDQANIMTSQWIYFPEKNIPFCRVHAPGVFSDFHTTDGHSILVFEYFCFTSDEIWKKENEEIINLTFSHFNELDTFPKSQLVDSKVLRLEKAYPMLDKERDSNLQVIQDFLAKFDNLHSVGRHGLHTYDNQHDAARTGINAVEEAFSENKEL